MLTHFVRRQLTEHSVSPEGYVVVTTARSGMDASDKSCGLGAQFPSGPSIPITTNGAQ